MKKRLLQFMFAALLAVFLLPVVTNTAHADTVKFSSGDFTYTITDGVASIKSYDGSDANVTVPSTVYYDGINYKLRSIDASAFEGNQHLQAVVIPQNVTKIGNCAFKNCVNLSSVTINGDLADCASNSAYFWDDYPWNCKYHSVFYNAGTNVDSFTVTFGDSVTRIPRYLFATGKNKSDDVYPHVTKVVMGKSVQIVGAYAFYRCYDLKTVSWGNALTGIGDNSFYSTGLSEINLPSKVEWIGEAAFQNCQSLKSLTLPKSTTTLYDCAFKNCTNLSSVTINGDLGDCDRLSTHPAGDQWSYEKHSVFYNAGSNADSFTVTFGNSVTRIPAYLFATWSSKSDGNYAHVTRVNLPTSLEEIGTCAFYNCYDLSKIYFRSGAPAFGENCFASVPATAYYPKNNNNWPASVRQDYGGDITWATYSPATITTQPKSVGAIPDSIAKFTVSATGDGIKYQWQYKTSAGKWVNSGATGAKTATLSVKVTSSENGVQYRCVVTDKYGFTATSKAATLTVGKLFINTQPRDIVAKVNDTALFKVDAVGKGLVYRWQYKTPTGSWKNSGATGYNTATLSVKVKASEDGIQYRCVVTEEGGTKLISNAATLTVKATITTQPKSVTASAGDTVQFKVVAAGSGLTYRWQYNDGSGWKNSSLTGHATATLKVPVTGARNGYQYRCVVEDKYGYKAISNAATLTVKAVITTQPKNINAPVGNTVQFKVAAAGNGLTYRWQYKTPTGSWKNSGATGYNTATLSVKVKASENGIQYRCVVEDKYGNKAISNAATLTVKTTITTQPKSVAAESGTTAKFTVSATGAGLTYQWQYKTSTGSWKNSGATGAKTATLSVKAKTSENGIQYRCVITDANGSKTYSRAVILIVW